MDTNSPSSAGAWNDVLKTASSPEKRPFSSPPAVNHHVLSPSCTAEVYEQAMREHAYELGIDIDNEAEFRWIAEESLVAPLTDGWIQIKQEDGEYAGSLYYYNEVTGASQWEHPSDDYYRAVYAREKRKQIGVVPQRAAWNQEAEPAVTWQAEELQAKVLRLERRLKVVSEEAEAKALVRIIHGAGKHGSISRAPAFLACHAGFREAARGSRIKGRRA